MTPVEIIARALPFHMAYDRDIVAQAVISALSDAGMVVVPRKPTEAMTAGPRGLELTRISRSTEISIYRSMIAAHEAQPIAEGR